MEVFYRAGTAGTRLAGRLATARANAALGKEGVCDGIHYHDWFR